MLTFGSQDRTGCSKTMSRRSVLKVGVAGFAGLTFADMLRLEAEAGVSSNQKAILNIHLDGGPPQLDTIDLKPGAPVEYRGEFSPIATTIPGFQICELMPKVASIADRFAFIRTLVGSAGKHDAFQCQSGFRESDLRSSGGRPAVGSVVSKLKATPQDTAPAFVDLMQGRPLVRNSARPGFLGPALGPFRPDLSQMFHRELEAGMKNELAAKGANHTVSLRLHKELSQQRLNTRTSLLSRLDTLRRNADDSGMMDALDQFQQQAMGILLSGKFADAMDLSKEDPKVLQRYTPAEPNVEKFTTAENATAMHKLLLARRVIEAGVRCVSVSFSDFDTHSSNFQRMNHLLPILDHGLHALITDLEQRGRLDDVSIVIWGEFGRTPRINDKNGGRDHWPRVGPAMLAGGGMRVGQVIGSTDRIAGEPTSRPVHYKDIFATLYKNLGIDALRTTLIDPSGRPQYLLDEGTPLRELL